MEDIAIRIAARNICISHELVWSCAGAKDRDSRAHGTESPYLPMRRASLRRAPVRGTWVWDRFRDKGTEGVT